MFPSFTDRTWQVLAKVCPIPVHEFTGYVCPGIWSTPLVPRTQREGDTTSIRHFMPGGLWTASRLQLTVSATCKPTSTWRSQELTCRKRELGPAFPLSPGLCSHFLLFIKICMSRTLGTRDLSLISVKFLFSTEIKVNIPTHRVHFGQACSCFYLRRLSLQRVQFPSLRWE